MSHEAVAAVTALIELGMIAQDDIVKCLKKALSEPEPQRTEQEQQIETLKRCLFQMQEAAKDLVEQAKSLTPPQRTWVGLTDEDKAELDEKYGDDTLAHLDAIEAKLKEKNT